MPNASTQLPRYKCHKDVWALKISAIETRQHPSGPAYVLAFENPRYAPMSIEYSYIEKHRPHVGGYYVVYADGYKSFSPADVFESGYTLI